MSMQSSTTPKTYWTKKSSERLWTQHGLIWRTLAIYKGLTYSQLVSLTGLSDNTVRYALKIMGGVEKREGKWYATGVTKEWLEVLL
jgi:hypothetical protein